LTACPDNSDKSGDLSYRLLSRTSLQTCPTDCSAGQVWRLVLQTAQ
jgi:hypothetical protein